MGGVLEMSKSEHKWQAECDARTLMDAAAIKANKSRHRAAIGELKAMRDAAVKAVDANTGKGGRA